MLDKAEGIKYLEKTLRCLRVCKETDCPDCSISRNCNSFLTVAVMFYHTDILTNETGHEEWSELL